MTLKEPLDALDFWGSIHIHLICSYKLILGFLISLLVLLDGKEIYGVHDASDSAVNELKTDRNLQFILHQTLFCSTYISI